MAKWNYRGDVNLTEGGYFWRHNQPNDDYADIIEVMPDANMGGADNVFHVFVGTVYIPDDMEKRKTALDCIGYEGDPKDATFETLVDALFAYMGMDRDYNDAIRIGAVDPLTSEATVSEDDIWQIRANWKLKNFVKKQYLERV